MQCPPEYLSGNEALQGVPNGVLQSDLSVRDFWSWAYSDLKANNVRGVLAEWIVAKLLNLSPPIRETWADCDLVTPGGIRIEVKAAAYIQTWEQPAPSVIKFSGLKGRPCSSGSQGLLSETEIFKADCYVFCVQTEKERDQWNALDLSQWRFYVLPRKSLEEKNVASMNLNSVKAITQELTAEQFQERMRLLIQDFDTNGQKHPDGTPYAYCIYHIKHSETLKKIYESGGEDVLNEKESWSTGLKLLTQAKQEGQDLKILFDHADAFQGISWVASIQSIEIRKGDDGKAETQVHITGLQQLDPSLRFPCSELRLQSTGKKIVEGFQRGYALCHTPEVIERL